MHPIQCRCGAVRGQLDTSGTHNRVICYCADCRAFARFLGSPSEILDEQGGTEIVQVAQPCLQILQGENNLVAVRLSDKGLLRWYTSCCNTAIGNTLANAKFLFIGLIHSCLTRGQIESDFGTTIALVYTDAALGEPKPRQRGVPGMMARFIWIMLGGLLRRKPAHSALFNGSGLPRTKPVILSAEALATLKNDA